MKKLVSFILAVIPCLVAVSCGEEDPQGLDPAGVAVTGIEVTPQGKILSEGEEFQLTATVMPSNASDKRVAWSSQKPEIASVDDKGLVKAHSQGITSITATTSDGGFEGRCMITVNAASDPVVAVTEISVSPATLTLAVGGKQTLQATVLPATATQKGVAWTSSDSGVASVSDAGEVTGMKAGTATVTATAVDGSGISGNCVVTVTEKSASQTLKFRYFDDATGNKDPKDAANGIELSYPTPPRVIFFVTEDGTNPISDAEASHYSVTKIEDAAGVLREESQHIFIEKLYGTSTGHFVFKITKAGTAKVTLSYDDGAGKKLTGTYTITYNESEHELEFLTGIGTRLINAHEPYSGPVEAPVDETNKLYVVVHDKTVDKLLSTGEFVLDVAHNDPESVAQYEAAVVEELGVRKGFAIQFKSGGYAGIGLSYKDGDAKKLSAVLQVHVNSSLWLSKSATGDQAYLVDGAELALEVGTPQSVYFFNHELKRNEVVYASGLKLTGGDASIAAVELAKDGKSLVFTPKKVGTTTWKIAYSYKGFTIDETLKVTVAAATVPVTSLTWDSGNPKDLNIGQAITYKVAVNPSNATDQKVTWTSSDPAVAEITTQVGNMANVKGLSVGTTTITATCGGKSVSGEVTVTAYYQIRFKGDVLPSVITYDMGTAMGNWLTFTVYDRQQGKEISAASSGVKVTISNPSVARVAATNASGIVLEALHRGSTMVVFSIGFQTLAATELKVNPLYGVFSALSQKSYSYNGQTEDYVLGYIKSNQLEYRLYDASAGEFISVSSGLNCVVDNPAVVQATAVTVGGAQYWRASVMKSGTATISFIYKGVSIRTLKLNVMDPHPFVDLGLSVKWATMNIGASQPHYPGNVYAWGETSGKSNYSLSTYKWHDGSYYTKYTARDGKMILEKDDDVAQTFWGWGWRMPTRADFEDLCSKCTWTQTTEAGTKVFKVTGKNGNFILIPMAGSYNGTTLYTYGVSAVYWTSERLGGYEDSAITMVANTGSSKGTTGQVSPRYQGLYVRAVTDRY